ncbi:methyltransferase domain-containing protein [Pseudoduganella sp. FT93W]|uniref:Methyltransferase domain-containing protein n=1 Tax=Duganella fentianensis TaxID=2692177 RepID=A0A845HWX0_9BURK|nr:class I SAM-dependent methyltransferase [Duganella fentianensis]MYN45372.1 methyltransferase domain-containing protein [Duganella fentianensis]
MNQPSDTQAPAAVWDARYASSEYVFGTTPNEFLRQHASVWAAGSRILCVADGEGRNSVWLAQQGMQVEAFDISAVGVEKARQLASSQGVTVQYDVADCDSWSWPPARYDGVAAIFFQFADPAMRARIFQHIRDSLKPGGILILQGYTPGQLEYKTGGPPQLDRLYTRELLTQAFAGMDILELREYEAELSEGARHTGRSALIGLVARG